MEPVANAAAAAENSFLKTQLVKRKEAVAEVRTALKKQAVDFIDLLEENIVLKKKLNAANTVIKEHVAEKATLESLAAENAGLAEESNALKKQLTAVNETLRKQVDSTALKQHEAGEDMVQIEKSVDTWRAREEELQKKLNAAKKWKVTFVEASLKHKGELMNQIKELEEKLCAQQEESEKMDEEVKLLIQQNIELQVRYITSI